MIVDRLSLKAKLLIPVFVSAIVVVGVGLFAAERLKKASSEANDVITHRDAAIVKTLQGLRALREAQALAYVALLNDDASPAGLVAKSGFPKVLDAVTKDYNEAAELLPEKSAEILSYRDMLKDMVPKLQGAFDLSSSSPGFEHPEKLSASDLNTVGVGSDSLTALVLPLEQMTAKLAAFNDRLIAENRQKAIDLEVSARDTFWSLLLGGLLAGAATGALAFWIASSKVVKPVAALTESMRRLAGGDIAVDLSRMQTRDEIGAMVAAVQVFKDNAIEKLRLEGASAEARRSADAERVRQETVRAEEARLQAEVVSVIAEGLEMLSRGRLSHRIDAAFSPEYERLRVDFNHAISKLGTTIGAVADNTTAIRAGTKDIASAADDLARRTEQQAASLEETTAALGQITDTVRKTSQGAGHVRDLVLEARGEAEGSGGIMKRAVQAMGDISQSSAKITQIISVIDEIAFQTSLLALNAGVEAARAGEAGRGFAVVASEVRALAQRSAEAAKEIKGLIQASSRQVSQGVDMVGQAGSALDKIMNSIGVISGIISEIAQDAGEQATSLAEVNTAVRQMDQVTQQNAAMVEESTAASQNVAKESEELARLVREFDMGAARATPIAREDRPSRSVPRPMRLVGAGAGFSAASEEWAEF